MLQTSHAHSVQMVEASWPCTCGSGRLQSVLNRIHLAHYAGFGEVMDCYTQAEAIALVEGSGFSRSQFDCGVLNQLGQGSLVFVRSDSSSGYPIVILPIEEDGGVRKKLVDRIVAKYSK